MSEYDDIFDDLDMYFDEDYDFLFDETTVYKDSNICIGCNPDSGDRFIYLPYFKITDGTSTNSGTKIARISFKDHFYIIHNDNLLHWELNNKDKKKINNILQSKGKIRKTIYEDLIEDAAQYCDLNFEDFVYKFNVSLNPNISDVHYNSQDDYNRAKRKGIAK